MQLRLKRNQASTIREGAAIYVAIRDKLAKYLGLTMPRTYSAPGSARLTFSTRGAERVWAATAAEQTADQLAHATPGTPPPAEEVLADAAAETAGGSSGRHQPGGASPGGTRVWCPERLVGLAARARTHTRAHTRARARARGEH